MKEKKEKIDIAKLTMPFVLFILLLWCLYILIALLTQKISF